MSRPLRRSSAGAAFERIAAHDPETRVRAVLAEQRDTVDRKCRKIDLGESPLQHWKDDGLPVGGKPASKRHMELKIFHHIGVSPAVEVGELSRCQPWRISPAAVLGRERGSKAIECANAIGGKREG